MCFRADYADVVGGSDYGDYSLPIWWDAGLWIVRMRSFNGIGVSSGTQAGRVHSGGGDIQGFDQDWAGAGEISDEATGERDAAAIAG
jgi:hypothetical protein